ncbi:MAG: hypothetical protein LQ342_002103 [Letrouitia transgressa]|nr:MAG: hypothetical protein LQ342_002103 [Letrouitia transgressa]
MGGPDFEACGNLFKQGANSTYAQYQYHGPVSGLYAHNARPLLITVEGCKEICGTGTQYYPWKKSSATITTWVLPVLGLLLQLPFESNAFWPTLWALARWCGSPIATLSYVFWNIKVTSKSAMMIDMSVPHNVVPDQQSDFSQMRDSLYILSVMNQYCFKRGVSSDAGEKWLRVALFSNSLPLKPVRLDARTIVERRTDLARYLREERKKGVVPVFFSLGWFLFSLALSIQAAFGQLGDNQTAHTLAFGLLLAWTPVLVIATIVDRHPTGTIRVRRKLNKFLGDVRRSLLDSEFKADYIRSLGVTEADLSWTTKLDILEFFEGDDFFTRFAGQGRRRWHHGVAHSILADSESDFIAQCGRGWLEYPGARTSMELGSQKIVGLRYFDFRMVWQIASATAIVFGTAGGAFILSCLFKLLP